MSGKLYISWRRELKNSLVFYKMDEKKRKYVECYDFSSENTLLVKEKLSYMDIETPNIEIKKLFEGICKIHIEEKYRAPFKEKRSNLIKGFSLFVLGSTSLFLYGAIFGFELLVMLLVFMAMPFMFLIFVNKTGTLEEDSE